MSIERWVMRIAGLFILASLALGVWVSPYWLLFTAFVGLNLFQTSFTGFCPLAKVLAWFGLEPGPVFGRRDGGGHDAPLAPGAGA